MKIVATLSKTEGFPCSLCIRDTDIPAPRLRTLETLVACEEDGRGVIEIHFLSSKSPLLFENVLPRLRPYAEGARMTVRSLETATDCLELLASLFEGEPEFPEPLFSGEVQRNDGAPGASPQDPFAAPGEGLHDPWGFAPAGR